MTTSIRQSLPTSTRQLEAIVRQYVNPSIARTIPEFQRSIVRLLTHPDKQMRRSLLQISRMYGGIPQGLIVSLLIAYYTDTLERETDEAEARGRRSALRMGWAGGVA